MIRILCLLLAIPAIFAVPSNLFRPCSVNDYSCIGGYLAANSGCNPNVVGAVSSNYTIDIVEVVTSFFNSTFYDRNLSVSKHDLCYLTEFYYNLDSRSNLLALRCPGLIFQSTRTLVQHYPEREDSTYNYDYKGTYPEIILTVDLRPLENVNLCNTQAFAYVSALPEFDITPNDKETDEFLSRDLTFLNIFERETFFYRANELARYFINSMICDFNCDF